jgi:hypothetical protein
MSENNKPEWFEIAENDGPTVPPKAAKTLPILAVFATTLILGIGALVAQVQENSPVNTAPVGSSKAEAETTADPTTRSTTHGPTDCWPDINNDASAQLLTMDKEDEN